MRIAIANAKGGVAKTTSSIYIASVIVSRGGRAVVYDADPQSSASLWAAAAEQTADPLTFDVLPANQATLGVLLQCLFDRFGSVFPQCGLMVFPGVVIVSR